MANSYLTHTHGSSATLLTKGTFSAWTKRSAPSGEQTVFTGNNAANNQRDFVRFEANSQLRTRGCGGDWNLETTQKFRDVNAWYHIVVSIDTTQSTASDRIKMYVNGSQITSFSSPSYPSQNYTFEGWSNQTLQTVGRDGQDANTPFDGYMSHVVWVDGQALAPTVFGETDSTSGIWKFKSPSGITFGNNGFHLKFENSAALGTDSSGNSNTFTITGNLKQALDTPSNVHCTMNSLDNYYAGSTFTNGNNTVQTTGGNYTWNTSTLGLTTGKWYFEVKYEAKSNSDNFNLIGIAERPTESSTQFLGGVTAIANYGYYSDNGGVFAKSGSTTSYGNTYTVGDIIGVALDLDNNKLYFHKNGTYQNSGVPTSGSTGTGAISIDAVSSLTFGQYFVAAGDYGGGSFNVTNSFNFGNGFFGTTAITSAGSNGNGSLFEYDVPTGYYAINTKNLNTYG